MFRQSAGSKNKKKKVDIRTLNEKIASIAMRTVEKNKKSVNKKANEKESKIAILDFKKEQDGQMVGFQQFVMPDNLISNK